MINRAPKNRLVLLIFATTLVNGCNASESDIPDRKIPSTSTLEGHEVISLDVGAVPRHSKLFGVVQKGSFETGTVVKAEHLEYSGLLTGLTASTKTKDVYSRWQLTAPWEDITLLTAQGRYFNECIGKYASNPITLKAYSIGTGSNLNVYSYFVFKRANHLFKQGNENMLHSIKQASKDLKQFFSISSDPATLDLYQSDIQESDNANLLLFSAALSCENDPEQSMVALSDDFGDNARIDGIGLSYFKAILEKSNSNGFIKKITENLSNIGIKPPRINPANYNWL